MTEKQLEREILYALRAELNNRKIKLTDLLEWSSSQDKVVRGLREGEIHVDVVVIGARFYCAVKAEFDKRPASIGEGEP